MFAALLLSILIGTIPREECPRPGELLCPCEFDLGTQVDGEIGLIIDRNGEGQQALANIDGTIARFRNSGEFRERDCKPGTLVTSTWSGSGVTLKVVLITDRPGEEACWYHGLLTVTRGERSATRKIVGACGC
jgi:hypothetical protein